MDSHIAVARFAALSQTTRLDAVRALVKAGPSGVTAGTLAETMGVAASTLSFHLKELQTAELITGKRNGRQIIYSANFASMQELVQFLLEDCCAADPVGCAPFGLSVAEVN